MSLLIHGASQVARISCTGQRFKTGQDMEDISLLEGNSQDGISIAVDEKGEILAVGLDSDVTSQFEGRVWDTTIDAAGHSIIPGLVDAHTHPVWTGDRVHEFSMKLAGASYMEVHKAGGGIHFTVEKTRQASENSLLEDLLIRLRKMSRSVAHDIRSDINDHEESSKHKTSLSASPKQVLPLEKELLISSKEATFAVHTTGQDLSFKTVGFPSKVRLKL